MPTSGCPAIFNTQFIQHSAPKTGVGSGTFTFSWTAPATSAGTIVLYAAGNAANGDGTQLGDHIYTTSLQLTPAATLTSTTTKVTPSANPSAFGQNITFTATVSPSTVNGTVTFTDGATSLGTATLSGGVATITVSCLAGGTHSIAAAYGGDTNDAASTSTVLNETVNQATTAPVIVTGGVVPIFSSSTTIQSGSWISIYGCNLAPAVAVWQGTFPTSLGGVSVSIDKNPAYIWFVSANQINVQVPNDTATGPVPVTVTTANGTSNAVTATRQNSRRPCSCLTPRTRLE